MLKTLRLLIFVASVLVIDGVNSAPLTDWPRDLSRIIKPQVVSAAQIGCFRQELNEKQVTELRQNRIKSVPDLRSLECRTQEVIFLYSYEEKFKVGSLRGIGTAKDGTIEVQGSLLPRRVIEAPLCADCDHFAFGAIPIKPEMFDHFVSLIPRFRPATPGKDFPNFENIWQDLNNKSSTRTFKGKVIIADSIPAGQGTPRAATELKKRGTTEITWHWSGLFSYSDLGYFNTIPEGVQVVDAETFHKIAKSGALVIDARVEIPGMIRIYPWAINSAQLNSEAAKSWRHRQVIIYSDGPYSSGALFTLEQLQLWGIKNLSYFPGGFREWQDPVPQ